ncbi:MAG: hypothetical protein VB041_05205, partial [Candidatus Limiplasma sp.]|nr:hypothetical protein [Candidatus Limiplasma sp.]
MRTRRVAAVVYYNGAAINTTLENYNEGFSYTDFASGESDTFNITLCDSMRQWMTGWLPRKGDRIRAAIRVIDWEREGDDRSFDCGDFTLDDFSFSGAPTAMTLSAIATPVQEEFKTRTRTQTWEDVTIQGIAGEIAGRYGLALYYDAGVINLKNVEQTGKNDCDFLNGICQQYGLAMKVYSNRLVIFDREAYKAKPEVITLDETEMVSWSWNTTLTGTYTSGEFTYTDGEN